MQLQIAHKPKCARDYTEALGPTNLEPSDVAVGSMPPNWASVIHYGTYELIVQRQSVPDGETAAPIQKRTEYPESLGCSSSNLVFNCIFFASSYRNCNWWSNNLNVLRILCFV